MRLLPTSCERNPDTKHFGRYSNAVPVAVRILAAMIAWVWLWSFASWGVARTVVLVFDDSGSMKEAGNTDRFTPALYATQNMIGLLTPSDRFEVVRMGSATVPTPLLPADDPQTVIDQISSWSAGGATPPQSVETAIQRLKDLRANELPDDEDYWLVVFTDGEFTNYENDVNRYLAWITSGLDGLRSHFDDRKLGILFLGIGPNARQFADVWDAAGAFTFVAPDVEGLVVSSNEIIRSMYEIAALVTGRDPAAGTGDTGLPSRSIAPRGGLPVIEVVTDLPLRRLVMFHQSDQPTGLRVIETSSDFLDGARSRPVAVTDPLQIRSGSFHSTITAITSPNPGEVLGPGRYQIAIDAAVNIDPRAIRFLPEVALGLELARDDRPAIRCVGDPIDLTAAIANSLSGARVDLESIGGLEIYADVERRSGAPRIPFAPSADFTYAATIPTEIGENVVSVTARYPGYFVLRSEIFRIEGVPCATEVTLDVEPNAIERAAVFGDEALEAGRIELRIAGLGAIAPTDPVTIEAVGLPAGWSLTLGTQVLSALDATVTLPWPASGVIPGVLRATSEAAPATTSVTLRASTVAERIRFAKPSASVAVTLSPIEVALTPAAFPALSLTPTASDVPEVVATERVAAALATPNRVIPAAEPFTLTLDGAPAGITVDLGGGATLSRDAPTTTVTFDRLAPLTVSLLRDREFAGASSPAITLTLATPDPRIRVTQGRVAWPLGFERFEYALEPARVEPIPIARTSLPDASPVALLPIALTPTGAVRATGSEELTVTAVGVPNGVALVIGAERLTNVAPTLRTTVADLARAEVRIERSAAYQGASNEEIRLSVASVDGVITVVRDSMLIPLAFVPLEFSRDVGSDTRCVGAIIDLRLVVEPFVGGVRIDPAALRDLRVEAIVEAPSSAPVRVPLRAEGEFAFAASIPAVAGTNRITLSASYPQSTFLLASQVFTVEGVACASDIRFRAQPASFTTAAVFGPDPVAAGTITLGVDGLENFVPGQPLSIDVADLPTGWSLAFGDQTIRAPNGRFTTTTWPAGNAVTGTLFASADAIPGDATFSVTATTSDERVTFSQATATVNVALTPVDLAVSPATLPNVTLRPTASAQPEVVETARLAVDATPRLRGLSDVDVVTVTLDGAPAGVYVDLLGERLSRQRPSVNVPLAALSSASVTLLRDRDLPANFMGNLTLTLGSSERRLRVTQAIARWPIGFATIDYTLEPARLADVEVARSPNPTPAVVGSTAFTLEPVGADRGSGAERFLLTATGLPEGIALLLADRRLTRATPSAEFSLAELSRAQLQIERSDAYEGDGDAAIGLTLDAVDGVITLRNRSATLALVHRARTIGVTTERIEVPITRTQSPTPLTTGGRYPLTLESTAPLAEPTRVEIRTIGLPAGVVFRVNGENLASANDTLVIDYRGNSTVDVEVLRSKDFRAGGETLVTLRATSLDRTLVWSRDSVTFALQAEPRVITIVPLDAPWITTQSAMTQPFQAQVLADGEPVVGGDFASWRVSVEGGRRLFGREVLPIDSESGIVTFSLTERCLVWRVFCPPGMNRPGERAFTLRVQGEQDEAGTLTSAIEVAPVGFWRAWLYPLLLLLAVVLVLWLLWKIASKPRFPPRTGVKVLESRRGISQAGPDRFMRFDVDLATRLSPFGSEKARVGGLGPYEFVAESRQHFNEPLRVRAIALNDEAEAESGLSKKSGKSLGENVTFTIRRKTETDEIVTRRVTIHTKSRSARRTPTSTRRSTR
jgi:hypothetical protein